MVPLWEGVAARCGADWPQGYLAFRRLTEVITREDPKKPAFRPLRDRPVNLRVLFWDPDEGGLLGRMEFLPIAEGFGQFYLDVVPLGFRVLDDTTLRSMARAWQGKIEDILRAIDSHSVALRIVVDGSALEVEGSSLGMATACGILALARNDILNADVAITGEVLPPDTDAIPLEECQVGWAAHVHEKLEAAAGARLEKAVVGLVNEGSRYPGRLADARFEGLKPSGVRTVEQAYRILYQAPNFGSADLVSPEARYRLIRSWLPPMPKDMTRRTLTRQAVENLSSAFRLLHEREDYESAHNLACEFDHVLKEQQILVDTDQYKEVIETLKYGLPKKPVHIPGLKISTEELLMRPGYPALLRAIHMGEDEPGEAVTREFEKILRRWPNFGRSAFFHYARGQAIRKLQQQLDYATREEEKALELIEKGIDLDGDDDLGIQIHRGLAHCTGNGQRHCSTSRIRRRMTGTVPSSSSNSRAIARRIRRRMTGTVPSSSSNSRAIAPKRRSISRRRWLSCDVPARGWRRRPTSTTATAITSWSWGTSTGR